MGNPLEDLARKAYDAYGKVTDHKNFMGDPMPTFDQLGERIQNAWKAAAAAIKGDSPS